MAIAHPIVEKSRPKKLDLDDGSLKNGVISVARWVIPLKVMSIDRPNESPQKLLRPFVN